MFSLLLSLLPLLPAAAAFDDDAMRSKKVYQLVTDRFARDDGSTSASCDIRQYCGGTWKGIANKLDYIKGMGFDTVWISPVVDNIEGETPYGQAYHGYWTRDPDQLNANFGSPDDLRSLASSLHDKDMFLMVDVVLNHVASTAGQNFQTNSSYGPFASQDDFHPFCWVDNYDNQTNVEQCWLGDDSVVLPDLNTQSQTVVDYWNNWIRNIVSNYTVDAIRLDTVKHVPHEFWTGFTAAAGVSNVGEVLDDDAEYIGSYQQNGSVNPFNYAVWGPLTRAFNSSVGSLEEVSQMVRQVAGNSTDPSLYGSFLNNHDNARFESKVSDRSVRSYFQTATTSVYS
jgi:alpha-amylase